VPVRGDVVELVAFVYFSNATPRRPAIGVVLQTQQCRDQAM
jgi:hypothetical protein